MTISRKNIFLIISVFLALIFFTGFLCGIVTSNENIETKINTLQQIAPTKYYENNKDSNNTQMTKAVKTALPAITCISTTDKDISLNKIQDKSTAKKKYNFKKPNNLGSGIIISSDGYILTNAHVIENKKDLFISLYDKRKFKAQVIGEDLKSDLAILKINTNNLPFIKLGNSDKAQIGDMVLAIGNPFGIGEAVTMGIISAKDKTNVGLLNYEDFIQTDAAINPGNSGGALINLAGELIGINTAIVTRSGGYEGIGFAIPSNLAQKVAKDIIMFKKVKRGWIGIAIQELTPEVSRKLGYNKLNGVVIVDILPKSPAIKAHLQKGDLIIALNKKIVKDKGQLRNVIAETPIGQEISLTIYRGGKNKLFSIKVSELPESSALSKLSNQK